MHPRQVLWRRHDTSNYSGWKDQSGAQENAAISPFTSNNQIKPENGDFLSFTKN